MTYKIATIIASVFLIAVPCTTSPIMVKFGTNEGPIVPRPSTTTTTPAPGTYTSRPAPVFENADDVPNPVVYKPLVPHQYRKKIYSYKPNPNLILGTPLDIKYTPGLQKNYAYQKFAKAFGIDYRGPQVFGPQEYEKYQNLNKYIPQEKEQHKRQNYDEASYDQSQSSSKTVPQIGVVYSSGVRYYVPQPFYYQDDIDNSVYEANDIKYQQHYQQQYQNSNTYQPQYQNPNTYQPQYQSPQNYQPQNHQQQNYQQQYY